MFSSCFSSLVLVAHLENLVHCTSLQEILYFFKSHCVFLRNTFRIPIVVEQDPFEHEKIHIVTDNGADDAGEETVFSLQFLSVDDGANQRRCVDENAW